jgi:methylthioribose-1-phosphate isomerase
MPQDAADIQPPVEVVAWIGDARRGHLCLLDQTLLPAREAYVDCPDAQALWEAIRRLAVRGAPAIGVAAAYGMVLAAEWIPEGPDFLTGLEAAAEYLESSRPTAVNLSWAARRVLDRARRTICDDYDTLRDKLLAEARAIHAEDRASCAAIGSAAAPLVEKCAAVMTHCNAGALATTGIGTATAGIYLAHARGCPVRVYCCETRPLLQGSRLTAWELARAGIDATVIADNMAAQVMREGRVGMVITGADRIAANGDTANKIGTYGLAILARHHGIPFYVAAPASTFDPATASGTDIPIEQRDGKEIAEFLGRRTAPAEAKTFNPAFDTTPAQLITAIITDKGIIQPVNKENVARVLAGDGRK